jgi:hypothetical protein
MLFMPESPRFLLHKSRLADAYRVWQRIRPAAEFESKKEFYVMKMIADAEENELKAKQSAVRFVWMDFVT